MRPRRGVKSSPVDVAKQFVTKKIDMPGFKVENIPPKGRGVITQKPFQKGDFLLHYHGQLLTWEEGDRLEERNSTGFRFFIEFKGKRCCIDATEEPTEGEILGRLVNHGEKYEVNTKPEVVDVAGVPALCLFALKDIGSDEELLYTYGTTQLPWRSHNQKKTGRSQPSGLERGSAQSSEMEREHIKSTDGDKQSLPDTVTISRNREAKTDSTIQLTTAHSAQEQDTELSLQDTRESAEDTVLDPQESVEDAVQGEVVKCDTTSMEGASKPSSVSTDRQSPLDRVDNSLVQSGAHSSQEHDAELYPQDVTTKSAEDMVPDPQDGRESVDDEVVGDSERSSDSNSHADEQSLPGGDSNSHADEQSLPDTIIIEKSDTESAGNTSVVVHSRDDSFLEQDAWLFPQDGSESAEGTEVVAYDSSVEGTSEPSSDDSDTETYLPDSDESSVCSDIIPLVRWRPTGLDTQAGTSQSPSNGLEEDNEVTLDLSKTSRQDKNRLFGSSLGPSAEKAVYATSTSEKQSSRPARKNKGKVLGSSKTCRQENSRLFESSKGPSAKKVVYATSTSEKQSSQPAGKYKGEVLDLSKTSRQENNRLCGTGSSQSGSAKKHVNASTSEKRSSQPAGKCKGKVLDLSKTSRQENTRLCGSSQSVSAKQHVNAASTSKKQSSQPAGKSTGVYVMTTNNTLAGRCYDKPAYCFVCSQPQKKLMTHIVQHSTEPVVARWLATEKGLEREKQWIRIRNMGNHLHNYDVLSRGEGDLIVVYRPEAYGNPNYYAPCVDCLGYYSRNEFYRHKPKCKLREQKDQQNEERRQSGIQEGRLLLPPPSGVASGNAVHRLLSRMKGDEASLCIKGDPLIVELATKLCFKHGHDQEQFPALRTKLRELARFVLEYREISGDESASLAGIMKPSSFEMIVDAARSVSGFNGETHQYRTPSLALKLGHHLKKIGMLVVSKALIESDATKEKEARDVLCLLNENWEWQVSSHALQTLYQGKRNNPKLIPLTSDVVLLSKYLRGEAEDRLAAIQGAKSSEEIKKYWRDLSEITLTQILLFNRKRQGEVSKLTMEDYAKIKKGESHVLDMQVLTKLEQDLAKVLWRVEIVGKRGRTVPVLLTKSMKIALDEVVKHRDAVGIENTNQFVFAMPEGSSHHIRASDTLRKFSEASGASQPDLIRSTQLRKHIATMSQVMSLQDNELDILANFLGHDVRVHRQYYRLPDATLQVAKVSKLLIALEGGSGDPGQVLQGKSLAEIDLLENEEVATEEDDDSNPIDQPDVSEETMEDVPENVQKGKKRKHDDGDDGENRNKQKKSKRRVPWTEVEKAAVHRNLKRYLDLNTLPGKKAIEDCMKLEPCLRHRSWTNIKDYMRNRMKAPQK